MRHQVIYKSANLVSKKQVLIYVLIYILKIKLKILA
jgi:hypothetical protein